MKAFFDSSVLVAAFHSGHDGHARSLALLSQQKKALACTASHCLAEFYAVTTGMPAKLRATPQEALLFLADVRARLTLVALTVDEHARAIEGAAEAGIAGGACHDAIIAACAMKAKAQTIYTWNIRHFQRLGPQISSRVKEP